MIDALLLEVAQGDFKNFRDYLNKDKISEFSLPFGYYPTNDFLARLPEALQGTNVTRIDLSRKYIDPEGAITLVKNLPGTNITHLGLCSNNIGPKGAITLVENLPDTNITHIDLGDNCIGSEGAVVLAKHLQNAKKIICIDLSGNHIDSKGAENLATHLRETNLKLLKLAYNRICSSGAENLIERLRGSKLTGLSLRANDIFGTTTLAAYLAKNLKGTNITHLDLSGDNFCTSKHVKDFVENSIGNKLAYVDFSPVEIDDEAAKSILPILPFTSLVYLNVSYTRCSEAVQNEWEKAISFQRYIAPYAVIGLSLIDLPVANKMREKHPLSDMQPQNGEQELAYAKGILLNLPPELVRHIAQYLLPNMPSPLAHLDEYQYPPFTESRSSQNDLSSSTNLFRLFSNYLGFQEKHFDFMKSDDFSKSKDPNMKKRKRVSEVEKLKPWYWDNADEQPPTKRKRI